MASIVKDGAKMEFPLRIKRQYPASLDESAIWYSLEEAQEYAKSGATSYAGQIIVVVDESLKTETVYKITQDGNLAPLGDMLEELSREEAESILSGIING